MVKPLTLLSLCMHDPKSTRASAPNIAGISLVPVGFNLRIAAQLNLETT